MHPDDIRRELREAERLYRVAQQDAMDANSRVDHMAVKVARLRRALNAAAAIRLQQMFAKQEPV